MLKHLLSQAKVCPVCIHVVVIIRSLGDALGGCEEVFEQRLVEVVVSVCMLIGLLTQVSG